MIVVYNDGGRKEAGYKGVTGDCVVRAIAIASGRPYQTVYDEINILCKKKRKLKRKRVSSSREGVVRSIYDKYLKGLGFTWYPTMTIGSGCKVHLREDELPEGRIIVRLSRHICAVINGVIHDIHDPSRGGTRCVYGYYKKGK